MIPAEKIGLRLSSLTATIKELHTEELSAKNQLAKFEELVDKLASEKDITEEVIKSYWDTFSEFEKAEARIAKRVSQEHREQVKLIESDKAPRNDLPKEELPKHNGKVETFCAFWRLFEKQVWNREDIAQESKLVRLCNAVEEGDRVNIACREPEDAKAFLFKKYRSPDAIRNHVHFKFAKLRMTSENDCDGAKALAENLESTIGVVEFADPKAPELLILLFGIVYGRIDSNWQKEFCRFNRDSSNRNDPAILSKFLQEQISDLLQHKVNMLLNGGTKEATQSSRGGQKKAPSARPWAQCAYCKSDEPKPHDKSECPNRNNPKCFACAERGHISKDCTNKALKQYQRSMDSEWRKKPVQVGLVSKQVEGDPRPRCTANVRGKECEAIIDCGSIATTFPTSVVEADAPIKSFTMADGVTSLFVRGPVETEFALDGQKFEAPVYMQKSDEAIIGADFLKKNGAVINMAEGSVSFAKKPEEVPSQKDERLKEIKADCEKMVNEEYSDLMTGIGRCELVQHEINTVEHEPMIEGESRFPQAYISEMADHIKDLLGEDVLEEVKTSRYRFRAHRVPKPANPKEGRLVVNFQPINAVTIKDAYPMPRTDH